MTKIKMIKGLVSNGYDLQPKQVVVRFTTDSIGESLSLRGKDFNKRK